MRVTGCTWQQYRRPEQPSLLRSLAPVTALLASSRPAERWELTAPVLLVCLG